MDASVDTTFYVTTLGYALCFLYSVYSMHILRYSDRHRAITIVVAISVMLLTVLSARLAVGLEFIKVIFSSSFVRVLTTVSDLMMLMCVVVTLLYLTKFRSNDERSSD